MMSPETKQKESTYHAANETLPVAVQLYSRPACPKHLTRFWARSQPSAIRASRLVGTHGLSSDEMSALLDKHGLKVVSGHYQLSAFQYELADVIAFNKAIGNDVIIVPALPNEMRSPKCRELDQGRQAA